MVIPIEEGRRRVVIEGVEPEIDCGRFPIKRVVGEPIAVEADAFTDGHDAIACRLLWRPEGQEMWNETAMEPLGNDRWRAELSASTQGRWLYSIAAWVDHFKTWRRDLKKRVDAGQDVAVDLLVGANLVRESSGRAVNSDARVLAGLADDLETGSDGARITLGLEAGQPFNVHDLLTGARYRWHGSRNFVRLDPHQVPAHVFRVRRQVRSEKDYDYFL